MKTWKNKAIALLFIVAGVLGVLIDQDATFLVFAVVIGVPLFFYKKSVITEDNAEFYIDEEGEIHEIKK